MARHGTFGVVLLLRKKFLDEMVCHCLQAFPLEGCGMIGGTAGEDGTAVVHAVYPAGNRAASARVYEVEPSDLLRSDREAEASGGQILGVYHSHTHTDAKPSPTDITRAPDPGWHYVLVSLRDTHPSVRSWRIQDGKIAEEPVVLQW
jgi:[CysO sulfur-carrier protein]-S-L-cysteine hydrolase